MIQTNRVQTALCAAILAAWAGGALAADDQQYRTAEGLAVYLGVMPGALVKGRPEAWMHGGVPAGRHAYHVMVAVFDEASGERLADLRVKATIASPGMPAAEKPLEAMRIADTVTYGNYFDLIGAGPFRIRVDVLRPNATTPRRVEFTYEHKLR